ncbi:glycosyltransferase family 39 protein [Candidatus Woesearchaeota archaeon]|nr:glycosyltransferase family 39 protein [Candidatus Woesearchaeota archaeon]
MKKPKNGKKKFSREYFFVILLFLIILGARLFITLNEPGFEYDAYDALRQAEHIKQTGLPLFQDSLSYSGRILVFPPFFYYLLAGFSFILPLTLVAKLIPSIAFSALVIVIYLIAKHITKNRTAAFIAALFSGFVPVLYTTLNQVSVYSLSLLLIFLLSYAFLRIEEKGFVILSIVLTAVLLLTHTSIFVLLISFLVYFLILRLEKQKLSIKEVETTLFLFFLALWLNILLYKKAFFLHGISFIRQNIPAPLLSAYFMDISFLGVIYAVGLIPLLLGVYAVYHVLFKTRSRAATLFISFALVSFIMLWLKLIPFRAGLLFLSLNLIILSAYSIKIILVSISKTRMPRLSIIAITFIIILFVLTTATPFVSTLTIHRPPAEDIKALEWIKENTHEDDIVLGRVEEGFLINYIAERKNVADSNFLFIKNINQRYEDVNHLFTLRLKSEAVRLINKYDIDYIFLSTRSMDEYSMAELFYAEEDCLELVYDKDALIYEFLRCNIE